MTPGDTARMRLLYVEDNRINALLFEEALRPYEWIELRVAEDGADAERAAAGWTPEVLVLDSHLPDTTGTQLLPRLRALPGLAHVPAFMCSADALPNEVARALSSGFDGYWTKPIDFSLVVADLKRVSGR
jgi:CheY-like chemotaxis protein